jgi:hypothetical protein
MACALAGSNTGGEAVGGTWDGRNGRISTQMMLPRTGGKAA